MTVLLTVHLYFLTYKPFVYKAKTGLLDSYFRIEMAAFLPAFSLVNRQRITLVKFKSMKVSKVRRCVKTSNHFPRDQAGLKSNMEADDYPKYYC